MLFGGRKTPSGFRFNGDLMAFLHEHGCRVPTKGVYRGIVVGMQAVSVGNPVEPRLAHATPAVRESPVRTGLQPAVNGHPAKFPSPFFGPLGQHGCDIRPSFAPARARKRRVLKPECAGVTILFGGESSPGGPFCCCGARQTTAESGQIPALHFSRPDGRDFLAGRR